MGAWALSSVAVRNLPNQGAHLAGTPLQHMPECQSHHDGERQTDTRCHRRFAPDVMPLEIEAIVQTSVDPLQRIARVYPRRQDGLLCGVGVKVRRPAVFRSMRDPALFPGRAPGVAITRLPALALKIVGRCETAILQRTPVRLEFTERHRSMIPRH